MNGNGGVTRPLLQHERLVWGVLGAVQLGLAGYAWLDLARRAPAELTGRKAVWALVIPVNFAGPLAYLRWGRR